MTPQTRLLALLTATFAVVPLPIARGGDTDIPRPEHPRPDFERQAWVNLNGEWQFRFDPENEGENQKWFEPAAEGFDRKIVVPFCWESERSAIHDSSKQRVGWYRRSVTVPESWRNQNTWLRFGAVDWAADVWVNGEHAGAHEGGYTPFEIDITERVRPGQPAWIVVRATDPTDPELPTGKQVGWYTPTSGIWQTVWLEARPARYVAALDIRPENTREGWLVSVAADVRGPDGPCRLRITSPDKTVRSPYDFEGSIESRHGKIIGRLAVQEPKLWAPESPHLYDIVVELAGPDAAAGRDAVRTYFGLRTIERSRLDNLGHESVLLNGKPIYLRGALDQSFNPTGIYTAPDDAFLRRDIELARSLGFNFLRIHIKPDEPRRLYWADKLGLLIMQDMPNTWQQSPRARHAWESTMEGIVARDRNHPAIFAWVLFNETWGLGSGRDYGREYRQDQDTQRWVAEMWEQVKKQDPTRLVEDNSPDKRDHVKTDLNSWHFYIDDYARARSHIEEVVTNTRSGSPFNYVPGMTQGTEPLINSEYGSVSAGSGDRDVSWGFRYLTTQLRRHDKIQGYVYTELSDIEWEHNGFVNYDRSPKDFGYDAFVPGMTVADLQGADFVGFDAPPAVAVDANGEALVPIFVSHFSSRTEPPVLRWWLIGSNDLGEKSETKPETRPVAWRPYQSVAQASIRIRLAGERPWVGALGMELLEPGGKRIAANFVNIVRPAGASGSAEATRPPGTPAAGGARPTPACSPRVEVLDAHRVALRFRPDDFARLDWNDIGPGSLERRGKFYAYGAGRVEYRVKLPAFVRDASPGRLEFLGELASKAHGEKLDWPSRRNPLDYPQTDVHKHPSRIELRLAGQTVLSRLEDDPADARGVLSHVAHWQHGSYGYLVRGGVDLSQDKEALHALRQKGVLEISFSVPPGEQAGGLSIFGESLGQYPTDPTLIVHTEQALGRRAGWTSDETVAVDRLLDRFRWGIRTASQGGHEWRYTTAEPGEGWERVGFEDSGWKVGSSGFGTAGTPGILIGTTWNTPDIWLRTSVRTPALEDARALVRYYHDEDLEVYVNGKRLLGRAGYATSYEQHVLNAEERGLFHEGYNVIAVHCHQTGGGQGVDLGLGWVQDVEK